MNNSIVDLLEKAKNSIDAAQLLLERGYNGFSVSRSYYAMFYIAEALLLTKGLSYESHKGVKSAFGEKFVKTGVFDRKFGKGINEAYRLRESGDYEPQDKVSKEKAQQILELAREFLETAKKYLEKKQ